MEKRPYTKEELEQKTEEFERIVDEACHEIAALYGPEKVVEFLQGVSKTVEDWIAKNDAVRALVAKLEGGD